MPNASPATRVVNATLLFSVAFPSLLVLIAFAAYIEDPANEASAFPADAVINFAIVAILLAPIVETPLVLLQAQALKSVVGLSDKYTCILTGLVWGGLHSFLRDEGMLAYSMVFTTPLFVACSFIYFVMNDSGLVARVFMSIICHFLWNASALGCYTIGYHIFY
jgi:hypothetical protein